MTIAPELFPRRVDPEDFARAQVERFTDHQLRLGRARGLPADDRPGARPARDRRRLDLDGDTMTAATPAPCTHPGAHVVTHLGSETPRPWTAIAQTGVHDRSLPRGFDLWHDAEQTALDSGLAVLQTLSLPRP